MNLRGYSITSYGYCEIRYKWSLQLRVRLYQNNEEVTSGIEMRLVWWFSCISS